MSLLDTFNALPTGGKLAVAGTVVAVGALGYIAFRKNSSTASSNGTSSTTTPGAGSLPDSSANTPQQPVIIVQNTPTPPGLTPSSTPSQTPPSSSGSTAVLVAPPGTAQNWYNPRLPSQHFPGQPTPSGGAHYMPGSESGVAVYHPLHSATVGSKRSYRP